MTEPISTRNLDRYGSPELPWTRAGLRPRDANNVGFRAMLEEAVSLHA